MCGQLDGCHVYTTSVYGWYCDPHRDISVRCTHMRYQCSLQMLLGLLEYTMQTIHSHTVPSQHPVEEFIDDGMGMQPVLSTQL